MVEMAAKAASGTSKVKEDKKLCGGQKGKLKTTYVMSPRELESVARRVMDESDEKKKSS